MELNLDGVKAGTNQGGCIMEVGNGNEITSNCQLQPNYTLFLGYFDKKS